MTSHPVSNPTLKLSKMTLLLLRSVRLRGWVPLTLLTQWQLSVQHIPRTFLPIVFTRDLCCLAKRLTLQAWSWKSWREVPLKPMELLRGISIFICYKFSGLALNVSYNSEQSVLWLSPYLLYKMLVHANNISIKKKQRMFSKCILLSPGDGSLLRIALVSNCHLVLSSTELFYML